MTPVAVYLWITVAAGAVIIPVVVVLVIHASVHSLHHTALLYRSHFGTPRRERLFLASLAFPECRKLLKHARIRDWAFFLAYNAKHPVTFLRILRLIRTKQHQRAFLTQHTRARVREARKQGDVAF